MISNALAKRQTVLVVCQKRAALEVVHRRLEAAGLDPYTVLLNKESEDRKHMYGKLKELLDHPGSYNNNRTGDIRAKSGSIDRLIAKHREVAAALSEEHFGGVTVRDLYARSSPGYRRRLDLGDTGEVPYARLEGILDDVSKAEDGFKRFDLPGCPWRGRVDFSQMERSDKDVVEGALTGILSCTSGGCIICPDRTAQNRLVALADRHSRLTSESADMKSKVGSARDRIRGIVDGSGILWPPDDLVDFAERVRAGAVLWEGIGDRRRVLEIQGHSMFESGPDAQGRLIEALSEGNVSSWKRLASRGARQKHRIREEFYSRPDVSGRSRPEIMEMLENGLELLRLAAGHPFGGYVLDGAHLAGDMRRQERLLKEVTDLLAAEGELDRCLAELREASESLERDEGIDLSLYDGRVASEARNGAEVLDAIETLSGFVTDEEAREIRRKASTPEDLAAHVREILDSLDFDDMLAHDSRKASLDPVARTILEQSAEAMAPDEDWVSNARNEIYLHWMGAIERKRPVLKAERFADYDRDRNRLAALLKEKSGLLASQIMHDIESRADPGPGRTDRRRNKLVHDLGRRRNVKPVRKLLEQYGNMLLELAPCWLASPEMVSSVFPLEATFDLVIVDEASQLAAERALPFLQRGNRLVIAGDEKQLRPNDLFQVTEDDEEENSPDIESLLDLARSHHAPINLRWHYRSRWQELIDFSNHAFYDGILQVSPNPEKVPSRPPIRWIRCETGYWERRCNPPEAETVIDTIRDILGEHQGADVPTIGVITFNDAQRNLIMDRIEARRWAEPDFDRMYSSIESPGSGRKDDEIFIRNIENVQGDERDIIIFSVGYAKSPDGKVRLNFGSLNREAGENRLNVAVTRASKGIFVVCSVDPEEMNTADSRNPGPKRLRDFLLYAKAVGGGDREGAERVLKSLDSGMRGRRGSSHYDSEFEEMVRDSLAALGYTVDTQVGQSGYRIDLAVVHPDDGDRYVLGIECDGATYHSARSVRERDVMRQRFLEARGWKMERIWSRNWWRDPDREIERIRAKIDSLARE